MQNSVCVSVSSALQCKYALCLLNAWVFSETGESELGEGLVMRLLAGEDPGYTQIFLWAKE